jgi:hypothetical protein
MVDRGIGVFRREGTAEAGSCISAITRLLDLLSSLDFATSMAPKRTRDEAMAEVKPETSSSPFMAMFEGFRKELDEHHDRRERTIKASRDITAASKKM